MCSLWLQGSTFKYTCVNDKKCTKTKLETTSWSAIWLFFPKLHGHYKYTVEYNWINLWHLETISHNLIMVWMLKAQQIYNKKVADLVN